MTFATLTTTDAIAIANIQEVLKYAIATLEVIWIWFILDRVVIRAVAAAWREAWEGEKVKIVIEEIETEEPIEMTLEVAGVAIKDWWEVVEVSPCQAVEKEATPNPDPILYLPSPSMTKTAIAKMKKAELERTLKLWQIDPSNFKTAKDMKDALKRVAVGA